MKFFAFAWSSFEARESNDERPLKWAIVLSIGVVRGSRIVYGRVGRVRGTWYVPHDVEVGRERGGCRMVRWK